MVIQWGAAPRDTGPSTGRLLVYLSGPITAREGYTVEENVAAALRVYLQCVARGIPAICPQLSGAFPSAWSQVPYDAWLAHDFAVIERCTHLLLLDRWETSAGARAEKAYAEQLGVRVLTDVDQAIELLAGVA